MHVRPRFALAALGLASAATATACACSPIDVDRSAFVSPPAVAARAAEGTRLSLVEGQARGVLSMNAAAEARTVSSAGAVLEAYLRWLKGKTKAVGSQ